MKIPIFPGKYHQNGGFSMAMLVYRRVLPPKYLGVLGTASGFILENDLFFCFFPLDTFLGDVFSWLFCKDSKGATIGTLIF